MRYSDDVIAVYAKGTFDREYPLDSIADFVDHLKAPAGDFKFRTTRGLREAIKDFAKRGDDAALAGVIDELVANFDTSNGGWASDLHAIASLCCLHHGRAGHLSATCGHAWRMLDSAGRIGQLWPLCLGLAALDATLGPIDTDDERLRWHELRQRGVEIILAGRPGRPTGPRGPDLEPPGAEDHPPGLVVLRALPETGREAATLKREFDKHVGKSFPLAPTPDVAAAAAALVVEAPHQRAAIDAILRSTAAARTVRLRPTILVGAPGAGKTRLARQVAEVLGVPAVVYPAGGVSDASLAGTSRQWGTGRPSVPLQAIVRHGVANPVIIVDEVEKASQDNRNGSLVDALLGMLEPGTAASYLDPYLEAETDLSAVSWILTANDETKIPAPLRDRCRIIWVPEPDVRHAPALVRSVLAEVAKDRDLDEVWVPALTPADVALIARAWGGGSVRKLRRCVETWLDAHDAPGLAH